MTLSRRKTLALIGGGTILAASGAGAAFVGTRTPGVAQQPWALAGTYGDPRKNALSYGLLAPNPHNLQPWQVGLDGDDALTIYHDKTKRLPETDPFDRQIMIGFGCFVEQMVLAAGAAGYAVDLTLFPDGEDAPAVARATFAEGGMPDPLAAHMMERRSCKEPFTAQEVTGAQANELEMFADIYTDKAMVEALKALTWEAWMVEYETPRTLKESVDLMRMGKAEINASPDGIDLGGAFLEGLMLAGMMNREDLSDPDSISYQQGIDIYHEMLHATPGYAALTSAGNTRADQIEAGRRWLRLNLKTTAMGLSLHPVSQVLQEYPEMAPHYAAAHTLLAREGHTVQMLGRVGYGPRIPRTPRWPLEAKLIDA
ncbi:Acg family FMN-binding oxidoreductase [Sulfitobacter aestuariivivens]|uniref:Twin-arginine translocation pathway signal protein n=1 Tax=Sulfitobacter aestuariivivens TaxID=2766981 RepID=A0A927D649_9RHOB|nr:twin-arginine translocation pathway signal protein [Sulfitobacter aestuariivivens]MBD3663942.1 twin-arginine translocation pathway signal protein [Sulfitobacter aestuariivivens]